MSHSVGPTSDVKGRSRKQLVIFFNIIASRGQPVHIKSLVSS